MFYEVTISNLKQSKEFQVIYWCKCPLLDNEDDHQSSIASLRERDISVFEQCCKLSSKMINKRDVICVMTKHITHYRQDKARHILDVVVIIDCNGHDADKYQHLDVKGVHW